MISHLPKHRIVPEDARESFTYAAGGKGLPRLCTPAAGIAPWNPKLM